MRHGNILSVFILIMLTASATGCLYHKPAFTGKVIDAETKEAIAGAVVVVAYHKAAMGLGAGQISSIINVRETLTNRDGIFQIPSYTTVILPFTWQTDATFLIFKPGYGSFPRNQSYPPSLGLSDDEIFFSAGIGAEREFEVFTSAWKREMVKVKLEIVELPKLRTREERIKAKPSPVGEPSDWKKQKLLIKALRDEYRFLFNEDPGSLYEYTIKEN